MKNYKKILLTGCLLTASGCLQAAENTDQGATGGSRRVSPSAPPTVAVDSLAAATGTLASRRAEAEKSVQEERRRIAAERKVARDQRRAEAEIKAKEELCKNVLERRTERALEASRLLAARAPYHTISKEDVNQIKTGKSMNDGGRNFKAAVIITSVQDGKVKYAAHKSVSTAFRGGGKNMPGDVVTEIFGKIGRSLEEGDIIAVGGLNKPQSGKNRIADFRTWALVEDTSEVLRSAPGAATGGAAGLSEPVSDGGSSVTSSASEGEAAEENTGAYRITDFGAYASRSTGGAASGTGAQMDEDSSNTGQTAADEEVDLELARRLDAELNGVPAATMPEDAAARPRSGVERVADVAIPSRSTASDAGAATGGAAGGSSAASSSSASESAVTGASTGLSEIQNQLCAAQGLARMKQRAYMDASQHGDREKAVERTLNAVQNPRSTEELRRNAYNKMFALNQALPPRGLTAADVAQITGRPIPETCSVKFEGQVVRIPVNKETTWEDLQAEIDKRFRLYKTVTEKGTEYGHFMPKLPVGNHPLSTILNSKEPVELVGTLESDMIPQKAYWNMPAWALSDALGDTPLSEGEKYKKHIKVLDKDNNDLSDIFKIGMNSTFGDLVKYLTEKYGIDENFSVIVRYKDRDGKQFSKKLSGHEIVAEFFNRTPGRVLHIVPTL